jgi:cytochrome P450
MQSLQRAFSSALLTHAGGHHACPGRLLAKRIMMLFLATLANEFDIEPLVDIRYGSSRFGFGVRKPVGEIPFRIRRRR